MKIKKFNFINNFKKKLLKEGNGDGWWHCYCVTVFVWLCENQCLKRQDEIGLYVPGQPEKFLDTQLSSTNIFSPPRTSWFQSPPLWVFLHISVGSNSRIQFPVESFKYLIIWISKVGKEIFLPIHNTRLTSATRYIYNDQKGLIEDDYPQRFLGIGVSDGYLYFTIYDKDHVCLLHFSDSRIVANGAAGIWKHKY